MLLKTAGLRSERPLTGSHIIISEKTAHRPGPSGHTSPQTEPNKGAKTDPGPSTEALSRRGWQRQQHGPPGLVQAVGATHTTHPRRRTRGGRGGMGRGRGAAGCDQDTRTYSARPRRMAKPQAIRANGAAQHVTAGMSAKGTCACAHPYGGIGGRYEGYCTPV